MQEQDELELALNRSFNLTPKLRFELAPKLCLGVFIREAPLRNSRHRHVLKLNRYLWFAKQSFENVVFPSRAWEQVERLQRLVLPANKQR